MTSETKPLTEAELGDISIAVQHTYLHWEAQKRLVRDLRAARGLLREVEWRGGGRGVQTCLFCRGVDPSCSSFDVAPGSQGHRPDCKLAAFLGGSSGEAT